MLQAMYIPNIGLLIIHAVKSIKKRESPWNIESSALLMCPSGIIDGHTQMEHKDVCNWWPSNTLQSTQQDGRRHFSVTFFSHNVHMSVCTHTHTHQILSNGTSTVIFFFWSDTSDSAWLPVRDTQTHRGRQDKKPKISINPKATRWA